MNEPEEPDERYATRREAILAAIRGCGGEGGQVLAHREGCTTPELEEQCPCDPDVIEVDAGVIPQ